MTKLNERAVATVLADLRGKIETCIKNLPPKILGVRNMDSLVIYKMTPGSYNLNFHIGVNDKHFIFRVNIEQQSGLRKQVEYEYKALKFLEGSELAPKVYYIDDSRKHFGFDILIEQYLEGPPLSLDKFQLPDVAGALSKLHSLKTDGMKFITWQNPLQDTYDFVKKDVAFYMGRKTAEKKIINLSQRIMGKMKSLILKSDLIFRADCLNHTDIVCDNLVNTSEGLKIIDWEKPRVDDCSYDISCFLSRPAQLWCSDRILNMEERDLLITEYAGLTGKNVELLRKKIHIREPLVSLHWMLWGATKLCDLKEDRMAPELFDAHKDKRIRYEKIARIGNMEKLLDSL